MYNLRSSNGGSWNRKSGFSLLEMLVGMGMLSIIVLALFSMFNQTQKALVANAGQSDSMEGGRAVVDLIYRDLSRARSLNIETNYIEVPGTTNISQVIPPVVNLTIFRTADGISDPVVRKFYSDSWHRDSLLHDLFYLTETTPGSWAGAGLFVAPEDPSNPNDGVGTLYRYEDSAPLYISGKRGGQTADLLYQRFFITPGYRTNMQNSSRLLDGVVFFRMTAFGPAGEALDPTIWSRTNIFPIPKDVLIGPNPNVSFPLPATTFRGRAFPTSLEMELGLLPTELLDKYRVLPLAPAGIRSRFLTNNAANILVLRQRIPMAVSPLNP